MVGLILSGVLGYLLGSVPTGVLVCRALKAVDVRQRGSGHTGGLNVSRVAGPWAGVLTGVVDALLGAAAASIALLLSDSPWATTLAGVFAVVGHDWSIFIGFGGGIGLSKLIGALLRLYPLPTLGTLVVLALLWLALVRLAKVHRARATILTMVPIGPLLWLLGVPAPGILLGVLGGGVVILKTLPDWTRQYG